MKNISATHANHDVRSIFILIVGAIVLSLFPLRASGQQQSSAVKPKPSLQVLAVSSQEVPLPAEFQMAMYENLITEIGKTGKFERIYRDGDTQAATANPLMLKVTLRGFKKGSAEARQVTTVAGATTIRALVEITDSQGKSLLQKEVSGKVHFFGENLRATFNFAKAVASEIRKGIE